MKNKWRMLHPATMFFMLTVAVIFLSWIFDVYGLSVIHPQTGELIQVQNLLSSEGIRWGLRSVITNFTGFSPLGMVLISMLGIGIAEHSGFINSCIRGSKNTAKREKPVILLVIFLGIISNMIGDAGYIILIPIAATLFHSVGLHPVAGIVVAYVSVACGFSANILISTLDPLLARTTQEAAVAAGIKGNIGPLANYYFMFVSTFLIGGIIYFITRRKLIPAIGAYTGEIQFNGYKPLSKREKRALIWALIVGLIYFVVILWATFSSWGLLRGITGSLVRSPFIMGILFIISLGIGLMGMVYGLISGKYRSDADVVQGLVQPMQIIGVYLVIAFFAAQMFACLEYSQLDKCLAIMGADLLSSIEIHSFWILILFIVFVALVNLIMTSSTAKWAFMAFIFVPVFAKLGISPDLTQCAYRIGDSSTNAITPFLFYMPLVLTYMQRYDYQSTYGTLLRYTWRYSLWVLIGWIGLFILWYATGLPLGL